MTTAVEPMAPGAAAMIAGAMEATYALAPLVPGEDLRGTISRAIERIGVGVGGRTAAR